MYYAGGPQQVTEYVSRNVQKSRLPPSVCNNYASYVRLGGGHTASGLHGLINYKDTKN
jgi:hypothetical protein